jgi:phosphatidylglycerol lysyltransferase
MADLLDHYKPPSEDFFKLWPHDKQYFFDEQERSGLAYHTYRGVAICLGDPVGEPRYFGHLLDEFGVLCYGNDWLPAFIHIQNEQRQLYEARGYQLQKIGQEAVVNIEHFLSEVMPTKYFRQINNKFSKHGYSYEYLLPPHHDAVIKRLKHISDDWLSVDGRVERGFVMGYFTEEYIQQCPILVARDAAGTIQGFINHIPASFDTKEATYDMLRQAKDSLGNCNDFLLISFLKLLQAQSYTELNLGLCPLGGLDEDVSDEKGLISNVLRLAYVNGDRFYAFSGLERFKGKYEPVWRDRYVAYQGGVRGFSRTMTALIRTMRLKK